VNQELSEFLASEQEFQQWDFGRLAQQEEFLTSTVRYKMLSGGFGTGKTSVLCAAVIWLLTQIPKNLGYLGRLDGKALRQTTLIAMQDMLHPSMYTRNDQQGRLTMKPEFGGSTLIYGDFKDINDLKNHPLGFFAIDQAEEVSESIWNFLAGRLRRKVPILTANHERQYRILGRCGVSEPEDPRHYALKGDARCRLCGVNLPAFSERLPKNAKELPDDLRVPPWDLIVYNRYGLGVCNPEGSDHWIYQMFPGLPDKDGNLSRGTESKNLRGKVQAWHTDTYDGLTAGFIDHDYVSDLEAKYQSNPAMYNRYLLGRWVAAEGLVYPGFNNERHVIDRTSQRFGTNSGAPVVPSNVPVYEYIDHGTTSPTAIGWVALEQCECGCEKDNFFVIAEHYEAEKPVSHHAQIMKVIRSQIPNQIMTTYLDSAAFAKNYSKFKGDEDQLYGISDEYMDHGIWCVRNQKDWDTGYNRLTELLLDDPEHVHPVTGEKGAPHFLVFNSCQNMINEFERYKWKENRLKDSYKEEPIDRDDHHMDGLNGFFASRPAGKPPGATDKFGIEANRQHVEEQLLMDQQRSMSWMAMA